MIRATRPRTNSVADLVMADVKRLRPLPASVTQAIQMLGQDDVDLQKVAQTLATDQVVVGLVLKHANSAYYGGRASVTTVTDGIMRIGTRELKNVLYSVAAVGPLTARLAGYRLNHGELFRHSAVVAAIARRAAQILHISEPEEVYAAGLLHDIGKLLLERHLRPHVKTLKHNPDLKSRPHVEIENLILGIDHATVGALMAERWRYPSRLRETIRYHHAPSLAARPEFAAIVLLADSIVLRAGIGVTPLGVEPLHTTVPQLLNLKDTDLGQLAYQLRDEIAKSDHEFMAQHSNT